MVVEYIMILIKARPEKENEDDIKNKLLLECMLCVCMFLNIPAPVLRKQCQFCPTKDL